MTEDSTVSTVSAVTPDPPSSATQATTDAGVPAPPRRREPRVVTPRGTPVRKMPITLHSEFAQRVYYRTWDRLKADLYILTVRTRTADQNEAAAALETIISESFDKARTDLSADLERTEVARDHYKVHEIPEYEDRLVTVATYSTPRAREFLALILQMDQLMTLYDTLWLAGFATTQEWVKRSQNWQRRLIKMTNRLRELANRTRVQLARQRNQALSGGNSAGAGDGAPAQPVAESVDQSAPGTDGRVPEDADESTLDLGAELAPDEALFAASTTGSTQPHIGADLGEPAVEGVSHVNGQDGTAELVTGISSGDPKRTPRTGAASRRS